MEPADPMERTDRFEPIDRNESADPIDHDRRLFLCTLRILSRQTPLAQMVSLYGSSHSCLEIQPPPPEPVRQRHPAWMRSDVVIPAPVSAKVAPRGGVTTAQHVPGVVTGAVPAGGAGGVKSATRLAPRAGPGG